MNYLKVKNWEEFQQYKDREPKWIKVYRSLLMDYKYEQLSDLEFGQLVKLWLLASQIDNLIPNDPAWIQKKAGLSSKPNITKYLQLDFLQETEIVQNCTDLYKDVLREEKIREEKDKIKYRDYVFLTNQEHERLLKDFGSNRLEKMIEILDNYIGASPKKRNKYTDHNRVLRGWVAEKTEGMKEVSGKKPSCKHCGEEKSLMKFPDLCLECYMEGKR